MQTIPNQRITFMVLPIEEQEQEYQEVQLNDEENQVNDILIIGA